MCNGGKPRKKAELGYDLLHEMPPTQPIFINIALSALPPPPPPPLLLLRNQSSPNPRHDFGIHGSLLIRFHMSTERVSHIPQRPDGFASLSKCTW